MAIPIPSELSEMPSDSLQESWIEQAGQSPGSVHEGELPAGASRLCIWCQGNLSPNPALYAQDQLKRIAGVFAFYCCQQCGSLVLHPRPTSEEAASFYEEDYMFERLPSNHVSGLWNTLEWHLLYRRWYLQDSRRIRRVLGSGSIRLLDVGCGPGLRLQVFREDGMQAEGIEVSERSFRYATERLRLPVRKTTLEELGRNGERFDVVTLYAVLEHIPDPRPFLRLATRLIRPGGLLVIRIPVKEALLVRLLGARHRVYGEVPRHVWIPSVKGLIEGVEAEGTELICRAPVSILTSAATFAISIYPTGSSSLAGSHSSIRFMLRRALAGLVMLSGTPLALCEYLQGLTSETDFLFRICPTGS